MYVLPSSGGQGAAPRAGASSERCGECYGARRRLSDVQGPGARREAQTVPLQSREKVSREQIGAVREGTFDAREGAPDA